MSVLIFFVLCVNLIFTVFCFMTLRKVNKEDSHDPDILG